MDHLHCPPAGEAVEGSPMQRQVLVQEHRRGSIAHMTSATALPRKQHQGRHPLQQEERWVVVQACTRQRKQYEWTPGIAMGVFKQLYTTVKDASST